MLGCGRWEGRLGKAYLHVQGREALLHGCDSSNGRVVWTEMCGVCVWVLNERGSKNYDEQWRGVVDDVMRLCSEAPLPDD